MIAEYLSKYKYYKYNALSEGACIRACEHAKADAYNWQANGFEFATKNRKLNGCRCYGKVATRSIEIDNKPDWVFCKKKGKLICIGYSLTSV